MANSLRPCGLEPARLICPWDFLGKNTGASCRFLLPKIQPASSASPALQAHFLAVLQVVKCATLLGPSSLILLSGPQGGSCRRPCRTLLLGWVPAPARAWHTVGLSEPESVGWLLAWTFQRSLASVSPSVKEVEHSGPRSLI